MFLINGVTKQSGSLFPLKCTLTTSLCNWWLTDLASGDPGQLNISSYHRCIAKLHTPSDNLVQPVIMFEAMDNSLIFASSLLILTNFAWQADCFQATYSWETLWLQSWLYALHSSPYLPHHSTIMMPVVDLDDPSSDLTTFHEVPISTKGFIFLHVPVDRPDKHFYHIQDIIGNFEFLYLGWPLPLLLIQWQTKPFQCFVLY